MAFTAHLTAANWTVSNAATLSTAISSCADGDVLEITSSFILTATPDNISKSITITATTNTDGSPKYTINGDGLYNAFTTTSTTTVIIENLIINNCKGDAITINGGATLNNIISQNDVNGAGFTLLGTDITLNNCVSKDNTKGVSAYGIYCKGHNITLNNCTINGNYGVRGTNTADCKAVGLFVKTGGYDATLNNCLISGNYETAGDVSASNKITDGYGVLVESGSYAKLNGCTMSGNYATADETYGDNQARGFGLRVSGSAVVNNCIITGNYGINNGTKETRGLGVFIDGTGTLSISNSTISGNYGSTTGCGFDVWGKMSLSSITIAGNYGGTSGEGIINRSSGVIDVYNSIAYDQTNDINNAGTGTVNVYNSVHGSVTGTVNETNNLAIDGSTNTLVLNYYDKNNYVIPAINANTSSTIAYAKVTETGTTNAVYTTADKTNITADKLSKANGTELATNISSVVTENYATTALNKDQLGATRSFDSNGKYVPGSIFSEKNGTYINIPTNSSINIKVTKNILLVDAAGETIQSVKIIQPSGKIVMNVNLLSSNFQYNLSELHSGMYIVNIVTASGAEIRKIII